MVSCSSREERELRNAKKQASEGHYQVALVILDHVIKRNEHERYTLEAAKEAARISFFETKDYKKSIDFFHTVILYSKDVNERLESQKQIASILFNNLQDYTQAISEYSKLIFMAKNQEELVNYRTNIARAQYYLNNFYQAESEIDAILKMQISKDVEFNLLVIRANIYVAKKEFLRAIELLKNLISEYPDRADQENLGMILISCYEEGSNFKEAIKVLENFKGKYNPPEYIELRIKRLQERIKNAPGAKGFRK